jgi:hypothetical protein
MLRKQSTPPCGSFSVEFDADEAQQVATPPCTKDETDKKIQNSHKFNYELILYIMKYHLEYEILVSKAVHNRLGPTLPSRDDSLPSEAQEQTHQTHHAQ